MYLSGSRFMIFIYLSDELTDVPTRLLLPPALELDFVCLISNNCDMTILTKKKVDKPKKSQYLFRNKI